VQPTGLPSAFRHRYATRLNSFRSGANSARGIPEVIDSLASIPGLSALELNIPQHFGNLTDASLRQALDRSCLTLTTLNLRYEGVEYQNGAFTAPDPATRYRAVAVATAPALDVTVIDTIGAGDAFMGAFAAQLARGENVASALRYGAVAGSRATTDSGTMAGQASHATIHELMH
jgi:hypothetical protein